MTIFDHDIVLEMNEQMHKIQSKHKSAGRGRLMIHTQRDAREVKTGSVVQLFHGWNIDVPHDGRLRDKTVISS